MAEGVADNRIEIASHARQTLETWDRLATQHATLGGGCACGMGGIALTLGDFELDIVDYVQAEAEKQSRPDVLDFLATHAGPKDQPSFSQLLNSMCDTSQQVEALTVSFILERLSRTLSSFEKLHAGR